VLTHIGKLKRRKSAGFDGITNEHILFGGLNLAVHICLLFNALLSHAFVPDNFCRGISQLTNLCTGIRSRPPPISRHPFRCSFGCVVLFNRMFWKQCTVRQYRSDLSDQPAL